MKKRLSTVSILALSLLIFQAAQSHAAKVEGLRPDQVLQRDAAGNANAEVRWELIDAATQKLEHRVISRSIAVPGHDWTPAIKGDKGWTCKIEKLQTGGPYEIVMRGQDDKGNVIHERSITGVLVGDLWVLAGQSNMEGVAKLEGSETPDALVHMFDMTDEWGVATEPLHERAMAVHPIYWNVADPTKGKRVEGEAAWNARKHRDRGAGLGLPFAKELAHQTGVPIGLLPCAYGGTSMDQWSPDKKAEGSNSLYGAMIKRIGTVGGKVKGVLWYQGESDANGNGAGVYTDKMKKLVSAIRSDIGEPDLPFYLVQIGRFVTPGGAADSWNMVQDLERQLETEIPHTGIVPAIDQSLDDLIHVDTQGHKTIGHRLANLAGIDLFHDLLAYRNLQRGPRLKSVVLDKGDKRRVRIEFSGVNGKLVSAGRLSGFSLSVKQGDQQQPFKVFIDPDRPNCVILLLQNEAAPGTAVWYGRGMDPYCNLGDEAGMGVLMFGPVEIGAAPAHE